MRYKLHTLGEVLGELKNIMAKIRKSPERQAKLHEMRLDSQQYMWREGKNM